jgi:hypothetical protein
VRVDSALKYINIARRERPAHGGQKREKFPFALQGLRDGVTARNTLKTPRSLEAFVLHTGIWDGHTYLERRERAHCGKA